MSSRRSAAPRRAVRLPAEQRRSQILDAAVTVFARQGFAGTGTADIAAAAGIGEPTIYRYFTNKRHLYIAALRHVSEEIREHWEEVAARAPDPLTALQRIGVWYFEALSRRPEILMLRARSVADIHDEEALAETREAYRAIVRFVEGLFERAQREGQLGPDVDVTTLAWLFMAVGTLLDQTHLLGLRDELTAAQVLKMAAMIQPPDIVRS
jgi:AcrR family transcriptional regulator